MNQYGTNNDFNSLKKMRSINFGKHASGRLFSFHKYQILKTWESFRSEEIFGSKRTLAV